MKKKLKKLIIGIVAITAVISIIPVKAAKAADAQAPEFSVISPTKCESIYRVANKTYINDRHNKCNETWNTAHTDDDALFELLEAPQVKKDAYEIAYKAGCFFMLESGKAYRYFLCGGEDFFEKDVFYTQEGDFYTKSKNYSGKGEEYYYDLTDNKGYIDREIVNSQTALAEKYKYTINLGDYNLNGLGVNDAKDKQKKLYLIDMENLLSQNENSSNHYKENIKYLANYIINNKGRIPQNGIRVQIESSNDGITVLDSDEDPNSLIPDDWHYAIGGSKGDILSKVCVKNYGTSNMYYEVELNYCLQDMYEWPGKREWKIEGISKATMYETKLNKLHEIGMSQDYRMFGSYKDTIRVYPNGQITCKDKNSGSYVSLENKTY